MKISQTLPYECKLTFLGVFISINPSLKKIFKNKISCVWDLGKGPLLPKILSCVSKISAKDEIRSKNGTKLGVRRSGNGETKKEGLIGEWAS